MRRKMHLLFGLQTLKQRLRYLVFTMIVIMGVSTVLGFYFVEAQYKQAEANRQLQQTLLLQQLSIDRWIDEKSVQVRYLAKLFSAGFQDKQKPQDLLSMFITSQNEFIDVFYVDKTGKTQLSAANTPGVNVSDREYYQAAIKGKEFVSDILISKIDGQPILIFSAPVLQADHTIKGLIAGTVGIDTLDKIMGQFTFGKTGETYLLDQTGRLITRPRRASLAPQAFVNQSEIVRLAEKGEVSDSAYRNYNGETVFGQYVLYKNGHWLLIGEISRKEVFASVYKNLQFVSVIASMLLMASFILTFILTKHVEKPIRLLLAGTKKFSQGQYGYRIDHKEIRDAPVELQQLSNAFNITAKKMESTVRMLERMAVIDPLTGVYNRGYIMKEGSQFLEDCLRSSKPCSVLMIDVDFFKQVNDTYGHLVGDRVIVHIAGILMSSVRQSDLLARYGGEEFIIVAPYLTAETGSIQIAGRIHAALAEQPYVEDDLNIPLTVSIGIADNRDRGSGDKLSFDDLISRADAALYRAKERGRNRTES